MSAGAGGATSGQALLAGGGLMVTALIWGAMVPFTAILVARHDPMAITAGRNALGLFALLLIVLAREGRALYRAGVPWRRVLVLGGAMAGFSILYTFGIKLSDPVRAAVVLSCSPLIAAILARIMYGAQLDRRMPLAILLAVTGAAIVLLGAVRPREGSGIFQGGELLLAAGQVCWNWYSMKAQQWLSPLGWSQMRLTALSAGASAFWLVSIYILLLPVGLAEGLRVALSLADILMLVVIGVGSVAVAVPLWNFGASRIGVPMASLYTNMSPVFAVAIATLFGAPFTWMQILGGLMVLSGVVYVQTGKLG